MKCRHCLENFNQDFATVTLGRDADFNFWVSHGTCPGCRKKIIELNSRGDHQFAKIHTTFMYPKTTARTPLSPEVPERFAADYREACAVLTDSPRASAALSRYCLQHLLREKAGVVRSDLSREIQQVLDSNVLPPYIADDLDAVRNIGNFAAHPNKSNNTGEVIAVEHNEAGWNLNVLEALFEFYFVQPSIARRKREALNVKLADAGKPPMKGPTRSAA